MSRFHCSIIMALVLALTIPVVHAQTREVVCFTGEATSTLTVGCPSDGIWDNRIISVNFASTAYGRPPGVCGAYDESQCPPADNRSLSIVKSLCFGRVQCLISFGQLPDWCVGSPPNGDPREMTVEVVCGPERVGVMDVASQLPVCARGTTSVALSCAPAIDLVIQRVVFASGSYGVTGGCGSYNSTACPARDNSAMQIVKEKCYRRNYCEIQTTDLPDWCDGLPTYGRRTITVEVICAKVLESLAPKVGVPYAFEFYLDPPIVDDTTLVMTQDPQKWPRSLITYSPDVWSFNASTVSVTVLITFLTIESGFAHDWLLTGSVPPDTYAVPTFPVVSGGFIGIELQSPALPCGAQCYMVPVAVPVNVTLRLHKPAESLASALSLTFDNRQPVIEAGSNATTVELRLDYLTTPQSPYFVFAYAITTSPTFMFYSSDAVKVLSWDRVPVYSFVHPFTGYTLFTTSKENGLGSGFREVCVPESFRGVQHFCVDPAEEYFHAQPFYLYSSSFPVAKAEEAALVAIYLCLRILSIHDDQSCTQNGLQQQFFLSQSTSCDGGQLLSTLGYGSRIRTTEFSVPLQECFVSACGAASYILFDDGVCGATRATPTAPSGVSSVVPFAYVIPVDSDRSRCVTMWCPATQQCLVSDAQMCDGVDDCGGGGEDEAAEMCCMRQGGLFCAADSTCLPQSKLCDGVVDCSDSSVDEDGFRCFAWVVLEHDAVVPAPQPPEAEPLHLTPIDGNRMSFLDCVRFGVAGRSKMISYASNGSDCIVYSRVSRALKEPELHFERRAGYSVYANIRPRGQGSEIASCHSGYRCSGNGMLVSSSTCDCICKEGFFGAYCDRSLDVTDWKYALTGVAPDVDSQVTLYNWLASFREYLVNEFAVRNPSTRITAEFLTFGSVDRNDFLAVFTLTDATDDEKAAVYADGQNNRFMGQDLASRPVIDASFNSSVVGSGPLINRVSGVCEVVQGFQRNCTFAPTRASNLVLSVSYSLGLSPPHFPVLIYTLEGGSVPQHLLCERQQSPPAQSSSLSCEIAQCVVNTSHLGPVTRVVTVFPNDDLECYSIHDVSLYSAAPSVSLVSAAVQNSFEEVTGFFAAGCVLVVAGFCCMIFSATLLGKDLQLLAEALGARFHEEDNDTSQQRLARLLQLSLTSIYFYRDAENVKRKARGMGLATLFVNAVVAGVVLLIIFFMTSNFQSNSAVLMEWYHSHPDEADQLSHSALPHAAVAVFASDAHKCQRRQTVGTLSSHYFMAAFCLSADNGEEAIVSVRAGASEAECEAAKFTTFPSRTVVPAALLFRSEPPLPVVRLSCALADSVKGRYSNLSQMAGKTSAPIAVRQGKTLSALRPELRQHWDNHSLRTGSEFYYKSLRRSKIEQLTSTNECRFLSAHRQDIVHVAYAAGFKPRLLVMTAESFNEGPNVTHVTALESQHTGATTTPPPDDIAALGPADGDAPFGFDFALDSGQRDTVEYYGIRGSFADIGRYFGPGMRGKDGEGVTISLYLRAMRTTRGFVFAVTDAVRDLASGKSPILSRAVDIMLSSSPGDEWVDTAANIYCGLYVDGPAEELAFVMANAARFTDDSEALPSKPFVVLTWRLEPLGLSRLFNGMWHSVNIILRSENSQTKAQLVVDGETSKMKLGWNQCVPRRPEPIAEVSAGQRLRTGSLLDGDDTFEVHYTSGMLLLGDLHGGVAKVEFVPVARHIFTIWADSTAAVRTYNAIDTLPYVVLGSLLLAIGLVFLLATIFTSGLELRQSRRLAQVARERQAMFLYRRIWRSQAGANLGAGTLTPLPFDTAKQWLGFSNEEMSAVLVELISSERQPATELVRLLYSARRELNKDLPPIGATGVPSASAWSDATGSHGVEVRGSDEHAVGDADEDLDDDIARENGNVAIDGGKLQFGSTQNATQIGDSATGGAADGLKQLIAPIASVLQSVYVWFSTTEVADVYRTYFSTFFSVICADITAAFASIPDILTPLLQLFIGSLIASFVYYLLHKDEQLFAAYVGRYTLSRDSFNAELQEKKKRKTAGELQQQGPAAEAALAQLSAEIIKTATQREVVARRRHVVQVLDVGDAAAVEKMLAGTGVSDENDKEMTAVETTRRGTTTVTLPNGGTGIVSRKQNTTDKKNPDTHVPYLTSTSRGTEGEEEEEGRVLESLGPRCMVHADRRLCPVVQSEVWPAENRAECCVMSAGRPCGQSAGKMYRCNAQEECTTVATAVQVRCSYCVCERHFRGSAVDRVLADLLATPRSVETHGMSWLLTVVLLFLCNLCYTPFLKTALMILACHPYFQCLFPVCWVSERGFVLGSFLSLFLVIFFGVGFPLALLLVLYRRSLLIGHAFFSPEYGGQYGTDSSSALLVEWLRFSSTDPTALGELYKAFELRWLFIPPMILAWKVVLLVPCVFVEQGTFQQAAGVAAVEFAFALFLFVTEPAIPPMVDFMYKIGATHQMVFLGLRAVDTHLRYHAAGSLATGLVALTFSYLAVCIGSMIWAKIAPGIQAARNTKRVDAFLERAGKHNGCSTPLYVFLHEELPVEEFSSLPLATPCELLSSVRSPIVEAIANPLDARGHTLEVRAEGALEEA